MPKPKEILYATGNSGKFEEVSSYITTHEPSIKLVQFPADVPEVQTLDQRAIAIDKAQKAWHLARRPLLSEDAGVYFDNYHRFPGTLTKFIWQGLGFEGVKKLFNEGDPARLLLYLVYIEGPQQYEIFEGVCAGTLTKPAVFTGRPTLPYGAIFIPEGETKTYDQLRGAPESSKYVHRLQTLQKFLDWYKNR